MKKQTGTCHICGVYGTLTYEHIPPKSAFNNKPITLYKYTDLIENDFEIPKKGTIQNKGAGAFTLCEKCNNVTGGWYGGAYVDWAYLGMYYNTKLSDPSKFTLPYKIYPLRVIKQIITMFFSVNNSNFRKKYPYLEKLILNKEQKYLPHEVKIYCFYMKGTLSRTAGLTFILRHSQDFHSKEIYTFSEISYPPYGYLLTIDSLPPQEGLLDISFFAQFDYDQFAELYLNIPSLPVDSHLPGDFRSKKQIEKDRLQNMIDEMIWQPKK